MPWKQLKDDHHRHFIAAKYLPANFRLEDPSDLKKEQIMPLLAFWRGRYPGSDIFKFKNYLVNSKGEETASAIYSMGQAPPKARAKKAAGKTPQVAGTTVQDWDHDYQELCNRERNLEGEPYRFASGPPGDVNMTEDPAAIPTAMPDICGAEMVAGCMDANITVDPCAAMTAIGEEEIEVTTPVAGQMASAPASAVDESLIDPGLLGLSEINPEINHSRSNVHHLTTEVQMNIPGPGIAPYLPILSNILPTSSTLANPIGAQGSAPVQTKKARENPKGRFAATILAVLAEPPVTSPIPLGGVRPMNSAPNVTDIIQDAAFPPGLSIEPPKNQKSAKKVGRPKKTSPDITDAGNTPVDSDLPNAGDHVKKVGRPKKSQPGAAKAGKQKATPAGSNSTGTPAVANVVDPNAGSGVKVGRPKKTTPANADPVELPPAPIELLTNADSVEEDPNTGGRSKRQKIKRKLDLYEDCLIRQEAQERAKRARTS